MEGGVRDGAIFNYNMFAYMDGDFINKAVDHMPEGRQTGRPQSCRHRSRHDEAWRGAVGLRWALRVRATICSPKQHNSPKTLEDIYRVNDVELFDVQADPLAINNLAAMVTLKGAKRPRLMKIDS